MSVIADILPLFEIVAPADQAEVASRLRDAYASQTAIYPIGGGTSLDFGVIPKRQGIGLSLTSLNRVIDYPARDMTITVESGITMSTLAQLMDQHRQRLPIDAACTDQATLGGVIATNWSGPRRFACGTIRDYVIGISAVDGRGVAFKAGGRVVKNVAGYDFCKLLTGSLGTLAVITQVTLKVRPVAEQSAFITVPLADLAQADALLERLARTRTTPSAIELVAGLDGPLRAPDGQFLLAAGLEGTAPEVEWMLHELPAEWSELGVQSRPITDSKEVEALWKGLIEFPADRAAALVVKANMLPSRSLRFVEKVLQLDARARIQLHAGDGIVIASFDEIPSAGLGSAMVKHLQPAARAAGGSAIILSCPAGGELTRQAVWGPPGDDMRLMQAVKQQFDPRGLLNPGRFVY